MDFQSEKVLESWELGLKYHQILCILKHVGDVEDGKRTYTHILAYNFLNI